MPSHHDPQRNPNTRKAKKKFIIILITIILVIAIGATAFMFWPSNISRQEAAEIAITHVGGGTANRPDRDFERFQRVWSVEVFYNGLVHEVYVSMRTGEVVAVEIDRWD